MSYKCLIAATFPWSVVGWVCSAAESGPWLIEVLVIFVGLMFSREIGGKVIFAPSRRLPWVLPMVCENQSLCCLRWRLCFGDACVYGGPWPLAKFSGVQANYCCRNANFWGYL